MANGRTSRFCSSLSCNTASSGINVIPFPLSTMRMMGALLISSLLIFPALTSMRLCHTFQSVVICSAVLSVVCFLLGMSLSFFLSSPAGATVVIVNLLAFLIFSAIARIREHTA